MTAGWLQLAHSSGAGCEQFLARSLSDALSGGARLVSASGAAAGSAGGSAEFVLSRNGGANREVVRASLDRAGRPTSVIVYLVGEPAPARGYRSAAGLAAALTAADVVTISVRDNAVVLSLSSGREVALSPDDFIDVPA